MDYVDKAVAKRGGWNFTCFYEK